MESIFAYTDYRNFLKDYYVFQRKRNKNFSHRYIAQKVGFKSAGHFSQILKGSTNLSSESALKLSKFMKLTKRESDFFEILVLFTQAKTHAERERYFDKMVFFKGADVKVLTEDQYEFYRKWYYAAIREILAVYPFKDNYTALSQKIIPNISPLQAKEAIALLERLELIKINSDGLYERTERIISSGYNAPSVAVDSFLLSTIELGKEAIDRFPRGQRSISSITLSLPNEGVSIIEDELKTFRRHLLKIAQGYSNVDRVFQVNFQVFPLSQVKENKL